MTTQNLDPWRPNLDGYHDPRCDIERSIAARTAALPIARPASPQDARALINAALGPSVYPQLSPGDLPGAEPRFTRTTPTAAIEGFVLTSAPGLRIPALLYRPLSCPPLLPTLATKKRDDAARSPLPAILLIPGHYPDGKAHDDYQRAAQAAAAAGFVVLACDPFGLGERHGFAPKDRVGTGTAEHTWAGLPYWWHGLTSARVFVEEAQRLLDFLCALPAVNNEAVTAMGSSGGATIATYLAAVDSRVAALLPATFLTSRRAYLPTGGRQDAEQILFGDGQLHLEHETLLRAIAPRPVCVLAARSDFFPIEGTRHTVAEARPAWGTDEHGLTLKEYDCAHRLAPDMVDDALLFLHEHLGTPVPHISAREIQSLPPSDLQVCPSGQIRDEGSVFLPHILSRWISRPDAAAQADPTSSPAAGSWLMDRIMAGREKRPLDLRYPPTPSSRHVAWQSEPGIWACGYQKAPGPARTIGVGSSHWEEKASRQTQMPQDDCDLTVWVRGTGPLEARLRDEVSPAALTSSYYKHLSDLLWLGDSLAAGQAFDLLRAVEELGADAVCLRGRGYGAYLCRLVAAVCPKVVALRLEDEFVDPTSTRPLWNEGRGSWHGIIPGLALHWEEIVKAQRSLER